MIRSLWPLPAALVLATAFASAATPLPAPAPSVRAAPPAHLPAPPPAPSPGSGGARFNLGVWTVHASAVDANFKSGDFSTPAKVLMTREGGDVTADRANGNYKTQIVNLNGHVVMHDQQGNYGGLAGSAQSGGPSTLTADKAQIDGQAKIYKAIGNVHYVQGDTVVDSENGTLNDTTNELFLQGNVRIVQGSRKINADTVLYNTITSKAHAQGNVTVQFPGQLHRGLATPKPLKVPKNPLTAPAAGVTPGAQGTTTPPAGR